MACWLSVDAILLLTCLGCFSVMYASSYQQFTLNNPKVCSHTGKKGKIKLTEYSNSAIVEETRSFDKWPGHLKFHCQFEVKDVGEDNDLVVFAVIQNLKFRKSEEGCVDYVEFESEERRSGKLCGEMGPPFFSSESATSSSDVGAVAPYAFLGSEEIEVTIHVARERLPPDENLDLKIAFTSAKKCYGSHGRIYAPPAYLHCGDGTFCILSGYANDSVFNCPFVQCKDEGGCSGSPPVATYHRPSVGTRVTIGAITTVLASFLLFFACIWVLRHYRKLCWAGDFPSQREVRMTPVPPAPTGPDSLEAGTAGQELAQHGTAPTAPPLDGPVSTILPDKDLPPPYESLFPATSR